MSRPAGPSDPRRSARPRTFSPTARTAPRLGRIAPRERGRPFAMRCLKCTGLFDNRIGNLCCAGAAHSITLPWRGRVGERRSREPGWGERSHTKIHPTPPPSLTTFAWRRPSPSRGGSRKRGASGEGDSPRLRRSDLLRLPLTPTLSPQAGRGTDRAMGDRPPGEGEARMPDGRRAGFPIRFSNSHSAQPPSFSRRDAPEPWGRPRHREKSEGARDAGGPTDPRASTCRHIEASGCLQLRKSVFSPTSRARCLRLAPQLPGGLTLFPTVRAATAPGR